MGKKGVKYTTEKIVIMLRKAELLSEQGKKREEIARELGIAASTLTRWRREFGGLQISQAKKLKDLEKENLKLKRIVANQAVDILILKDYKEGNL